MVACVLSPAYKRKYVQPSRILWDNTETIFASFCTCIERVLCYRVVDPTHYHFPAMLDRCLTVCYHPRVCFSSPGANVKLQNLSRDGPLGQHNGKHGVIREVLSSGKIKVPHPLAIRLDPSIAAHSRDSTRATACPSFLPALAAVVLLG